MWIYEIIAKRGHSDFYFTCIFSSQSGSIDVEAAQPISTSLAVLVGLNMSIVHKNLHYQIIIIIFNAGYRAESDVISLPSAKSEPGYPPNPTDLPDPTDFIAHSIAGSYVDDPNPVSSGHLADFEDSPTSANFSDPAVPAGVRPNRLLINLQQLQLNKYYYLKNSLTIREGQNSMSWFYFF